ncbi:MULTISPECIES: hypothetical protein [Pseudomonas]|uniref:Uncharacterized protein n=1 Tax=Pseudomonas putida (strain GB-1) TaxID=76869 RepID=B0KFC9_PSEPG|nr:MULTISPECIES: hypothetical protein [Pseudomonas]ABY98852.1 hypothetical protein PputGB1_2960 [Pseudomonas putida GB-1]MCK2190819.1 hypothetical protein [Pseudomonas sp. MB04B]MDD2088222.1 hypothetical protein [Pseudomonas putida]MDD2098195.1 hypothetical protein [Pseudomonas putida]
MAQLSVGQIIKRTLEGMAKAGAPLLREALEAKRAHRDAEDCGAPAEPIERLKLLADTLHHAVSVAGNWQFARVSSLTSEH